MATGRATDLYHSIIFLKLCQYPIIYFDNFDYLLTIFRLSCMLRGNIALQVGVIRPACA